MLISHRKQFIFTKTLKTAGTSIESYFEKYCMPEGEWQKYHQRNEYVSKDGIIGFRGKSKPRGTTFYHHMPAKKIKKLEGNKIWSNYFKFTAVRNPFEKLLSLFLMYENINKNLNYKQKTVSFLMRLAGHRTPRIKVKGENEVERFRYWLRKGGGTIDRDKYVINGQVCVDYFIKFENLHEDIEHVCNKLSIPYEPSRFPKFKKNKKSNKIPVRDYYDEATIKIVKNMYSWEIDRFGYDIPE